MICAVCREELVEVKPLTPGPSTWVHDDTKGPHTHQVLVIHRLA